MLKKAESATLWKVPGLTRRKGRAGPFVVLCLAVAAAILLLKLSEALLFGGFADFDRAIFLSFRDAADPAKPLGPVWLQIAARDVTSLGSPAILTILTITASGFLLLRRHYAEVFLLLAAVTTGALVSNGLKALFERSRPDFVAEVALTQTYSFPSGHAFLSALTFLTLGALLARSQHLFATKVYLIGIAVALTLLVGFSRVYLGVHWPTDVLAGWLAGGIWAAIWWTFEAWLQRHGKLPAR